MVSDYYGFGAFRDEKAPRDSRDLGDYFLNGPEEVGGDKASDDVVGLLNSVIL